MNIALINGFVGIAGVDQGYRGLPYRRAVLEDSVNGPGTPAIQTAWLPTPDQMAVLQKGGAVLVTTLGTGIVPMSLDVEPGPLQSMEPGDRRPAGWTEALALSFIVERCNSSQGYTFAKAFCEGDWPAIEEDWPDFCEFVESRS